MPGFGQFIGVLPFWSPRHPLEGKPRTVAYDVEILVSANGAADVDTVPGILFFYVAPGSLKPVEDQLYFVHGKIGCMDCRVPVGDDRVPKQYNFIIEADSVRVLLNPSFPWLICLRFTLFLAI